MQDDLVFFRPPDPMLDDQLLELYIAGECTLTEQRRFERWLADNPKSADGIRTMRAASRAEALDAQMPVGIDIEAAEARIVERVGWRAITLRHGVNRTTKFAVAATTAIALAVIAFALPTSTLNPWRAESPGNIAGSTTYTTGNADHATVKLPDGSVVTLNSASRLDVPGDYGSGNRTLRLEGEALFQVVGRARAPFVVMAGGTATRVLGTRFTVRHYAADKATVVAVHEGKVAVRDRVLSARQRLEVLPSGVVMLSTITRVNETFADGVLVFNGVLLADAIVDINRWYDVDIRLGDASLETRELRWKVSRSSTADLMEILQVTLNVRIVRDGRVLTLYPR